jgi:hypothetical protein
MKTIATRGSFPKAKDTAMLNVLSIDVEIVNTFFGMFPIQIAEQYISDIALCADVFEALLGYRDELGDDVPAETVVLEVLDNWERGLYKNNVPACA